MMVLVLRHGWAALFALVLLLPDTAAAAGAAKRLWVDVPVEDPGHKGLGHVFRQLACLKTAGGAKKVRIAHYGDSIIAGDRVSSGARKVLQKHFGDGGHGYLLLVPPSRWYHRAGVKYRKSRFWRTPTIQNNWLKTRRYGYGGGQTRTWATGAWVRLKLQREGTVGGRASQLHVYYERNPRGGWLRVKRGRVELGRVDTRGTRGVGAHAALRFTDGNGHLKVELGGGGGVRLYGVALERDGPGVVWDGLGLTGARYETLLRVKRKSWQSQVRLRKPALMVFQYGANISDLRRLPEPWYRRSIRHVFARLKPLRGQVSCLVVGPVDRGFHWRRRRPSRPVVKDIVRVQREEALKHGCAFWSARAAMGGDGAARRWSRARPPLIWNDLTHLRPAGAEVVGRQLGKAILTAYLSWRRANPQVTCGR